MRTRLVKQNWRNIETNKYVHNVHNESINNERQFIEANKMVQEVIII